MILKIFVDKSKPETPWVLELPDGTHINAKTISITGPSITHGKDGRYYIHYEGEYKVCAETKTIVLI